MVRYIAGTLLTFFALGEMVCSLLPPVSRFVPIFFFHCSCNCKTLFSCFFEPVILLMIGLLLLMDRISVCFKEGLISTGYILISWGLLALGIAGNSHFVLHIRYASIIAACVGAIFLATGGALVFAHLKQTTAY